MNAITSCTKLFAPAAPGKPKRSSWSYAEDLPRRSVKSYLCPLGTETKGEACAGCISQCGYGKRFISADPVIAKPPVAKKAKPRRMCQAFKPDGEIVGQWATLLDAAYAISGNANAISKAINRAIRHRGMMFRWVEVEG